MELFDYLDPQRLAGFLVSLGIGLLMGLERERRPSGKAGLRTFALTALFGTLCAFIAERTGSPWLPAAGLAAIAAMIIAAHTVRPDPEDPGTTTVVALLLCFVLGVLVGLGEEQLATMIAIGSTVLLYFKTELHGIAARLTRQDLISILQFAVLSLVVLPILPDQGYGPQGALNPYQAWLMVVLVSGVSLAGYAALRIAGNRHGAPVVGLFGGLVSSTATTLVFARHARDNRDLIPTAALVVLLANLVMLVRLMVIAAVLAPRLLSGVLWVFGPGLAAGIAAVALIWHRLEQRSDLPVPEVSNPTELRTALTFGALYAVVLQTGAWLRELVGDTGMYAVALLSGLTDVDAVSLSALRLFDLGQLAGQATVTTMVLAAFANLVFKGGVVWVTGGTGLVRRVAPGFGVIMLMMAVALWLQ
jgi:uncharacterized membrane protein (DUF4010 family)